MNSLKSMKVIVYHANFTEFNNLYNSDGIKFKTKIEDYNIYFEAVLSIDDIKSKFDNLVNSNNLSSREFEDMLNKISNDLCRIIYNDKMKCLFVVSENIDKWRSVAKKLGLIEWQILNKSVVESLKQNRIKNISAIGMDIIEDSEQYNITFHGEKIEEYEKYHNYLKNLSRITMIKKKFEKFEAEIWDENYFVIYTYDIENNLRKNLSKVIGLGE